MMRFVLPALQDAALLPAIAAAVLAAVQIGRAESRQSALVAYDAQAKALLAKMTLEEKVGQMCQPDQWRSKTQPISRSTFSGSLLSGGGSGPKNKADYTLQGWTDMVDRLTSGTR